MTTSLTLLFGAKKWRRLSKWVKRITLHLIGFAKSCQKEHQGVTEASNLMITLPTASENIGLCIHEKKQLSNIFYPKKAMNMSY